MFRIQNAHLCRDNSQQKCPADFSRIDRFQKHRIWIFLIGVGHLSPEKRRALPGKFRFVRIRSDQYICDCHGRKPGKQCAFPVFQQNHAAVIAVSERTSALVGLEIFYIFRRIDKRIPGRGFDLNRIACLYFVHCLIPNPPKSAA